MSDYKSYLEPISSDFPCGDETSAGSLWQIDELFNPVTPEDGNLLKWTPDWKEVGKTCDRLLGQCKHIKLALAWTLVELRDEGLPGFRDGLQLLSQWMDRYWGALYPQLDMEVSDPYDQAFSRMNELRSLTAHDIGGVSVLTWLDRAPFCMSRSFGTLSFRSVAIIRGSVSAAEGEETPSLAAAQLEAAFREYKESAPDALQAQYQAILESMEILGRIDTFLSGKVGAGRGPNFRDVQETLELMKTCLADCIDESGSAQESAAAPGAAQSSSDAPAKRGGGGGGVKGSIESREDVLVALKAIQGYYTRYEPSSPVPFLLQRAGRLVNMSFMDILSDVAPDALAQTKLILGVKDEPAADSGSSS